MRRLALALPLIAGALLAGCTVDDYGGSGTRVYDGGSAYLPGPAYGAPAYGSYGGPLYGYGYGAPYYGYGGPAYRYYEPYRYGRDRDDHNDHDRRFDRQGNDTVCDRLTKACYKNGDIDASETRDRFGNQAGRRVDNIRDRNRTNDVFLPKPGIICNDRNNVCKSGGDPSRRLTRQYFGNQAAKQVGQGPGRDENRKAQSSRGNSGDNQRRAQTVPSSARANGGGNGGRAQAVPFSARANGGGNGGGSSRGGNHR